MDTTFDEARKIRRTVRDLVALSTLPAVWVGYHPPQIAESLADLLLNSLPLDFVYLRLGHEADGRGTEVARAGRRPTSAGRAREIGGALAPWLDQVAIGSVETIPNPVGRGTSRILLVPFGAGGDGILVAGSQRPGFPTDDDRLLLNVGVNQASIVLQRLRAEEALRQGEERLAAELAAMTRIQEVSGRLVQSGDSTSLLLEIVDAAIAVTAADMGNIQLRGRGSGELQIVASRGFERPFLDFFGTVPSGQAACGSAMRTGRRVVIEDVTTSPVFAGTPALEVMLAAKARAVQSTPLFNRAGQLVGMLSTYYHTPRRPAHRDLRHLDLLARQAADWIERTQTEESMRESEGRFRGTFENAAVGIAHMDAEGRFLRVNQTYCDIVGYTRDELLERSFQEITHPADLLVEIERYNALMSGKLSNYTLDERYIRKDGSLVWIDLTLSLQRDAEGRPAYAIAVLEDISDRKRAEEALRLANVRLDLAVRGSNIGIWEAEIPDGTPRNGRIIATNLWEQLGHDRPEFPSEYDRAMALVHPEDRERLDQALQAYLARTTGEFESEHRALHRDGSYHWILSRGVAVDGAAGQPARLVGTDQDITERKRTDEALRQAKEAAEAANRAKDDFLANVSHEIRTPFGAILGMTEVVLGTDHLTEDQRQCLLTVRSAAGSLLGLINDLLDFSKIEAGKLELDLADFALRASLGETLQALALLARQKGLELACHVAPDVPDHLIGDAGRLRQVLVNLVGNAIKFTPQGKVGLRVDVDCAPTPEGEIGLHFAVSDTGIGIPRDKRQKIFQAFEQEAASTRRKYGGTGLGLAIAARLAALMGGEITVESEPGRGSTFAFTARFRRQPQETVAVDPSDRLLGLPVLVVDDNAANRHILQVMSRAEGCGPEREPTPPPAQVGDGRGAAPEPLSILAAEDDEFNARLLERLLTGRGHRLRIAANGQEALDLVERTPVDILLLDLHLPVVDGIHVVRTIRAREQAAGGHLPIIALTARSREEDRNHCLEAGMDDYLAKPVRAAELFAAITRVASAREVPRPA